MIVFKGAQLRRYELGTELLDRLIEDVKDIASLEPGSRSQRRMITALIVPSKEVEQTALRQGKEAPKSPASGSGKPKEQERAGGEAPLTAEAPAPQALPEVPRPSEQEA
jgi:translation initiation factor IF-3